MPFDPPFVLNDRYEVTAEIGRGGQSVVYRAFDRVLRRDVAVKLLRDDAQSSPMLARFRQEMEVTAQLEHAHILHVYDTGSHRGLPFIVMELAPGLTLTDRLEREKQLPIVDALQITREVGLALVHAHQRGIVHRDVKPDNILLGPGGALLADFGVARITQSDMQLHITSTGTAVGTLLYMSPEQLCAEPDIDARADQYSLACVLYEMLAGVRPHVASSFEGLRMLRMTGRHSPVSIHRAMVPPPVERAVDIALSPMSADRFRNMNEFLTALGAANSADFRVSDVGMPVHITPPAPEGLVHGSAHGSSGGRRWPSWRALSLIGSGVASVAAIWLLYQRSGTATEARDAIARSEASGIEQSDMRVRLDVAASDRANHSADSATVQGIVRALQAELRAWSGVEVVEGSTRAHPALTIRPAVNVVNDSVRLELLVQSPASRTTRRVERLVSLTQARAPASLVHDLTLEAFAGGANVPLALSDMPGVEMLPKRSFAALRSYTAGFAALRAGDFTTAARHFSASAKAAPGFGHAEFWAGQSGAWGMPDSPPAWQPHADAALRTGTLHGADSALAAALSALGRGAFPAACDAYRQATILQPSSFEAWFGMGECQRLDDVVETGRMGSRFRSSHWNALLAYEKALPHARTSEWLGALMPVVVQTTYAEANRTRPGRALRDPQTRYSALPSMSADTLAFIPVVQSTFATSPVPDMWVPAVRRGQAIARRLTQDAVKQWTQSPSLWLQRAIALEISGMVTPTMTGEDAGSALVRAEAGTPAPGVAAQIAVARVRVALRRSDFATAATIARRAVASAPTTDPEVRRTLAPLALLTGDIDAAVALSLPDPDRDSDVPVQVADSITVFTLRAQSGACQDLSRNRASLDSLFASAYSEAERPVQRQRLLAEPYFAAVQCLGARAVNGFESSLLLHRIYTKIAANETTAARLLLDSLKYARRNTVRSSITWDAVYREAWATVQAGDTASARAQLVEALDNIANMSRFTLDEPAQAAGLRRGVQLLVAIADPKAPDAARRRWAAMASALRPRE